LHGRDTPPSRRRSPVRVPILMVADDFDWAPLDSLIHTAAPDPMVLASALADAAAAIARLDQALAGHPLAQAFLYRARLESVRRMAAFDGQLIDPWHLVATIEGLRLRMDPYFAAAPVFWTGG